MTKHPSLVEPVEEGAEPVYTPPPAPPIIREQVDLTPILERLDRIEQVLREISGKVDITLKEEEVLELLKTEVLRKK